MLKQLSDVFLLTLLTHFCHCFHLGALLCYVPQYKIINELTICIFLFLSEINFLQTVGKTNAHKSITKLMIISLKSFKKPFFFKRLLQFCNTTLRASLECVTKRFPSSDWSTCDSWLWRTRQQRVCPDCLQCFFNLVSFLYSHAPKFGQIEACESHLRALLSRCAPQNMTEPSVSSISLRNCHGGLSTATQVCKQK